MESPTTDPHTPRSRRPRIVVFAYDARPGEGSEPGAGWATIRLIARIGDVWVITRSGRPADGGYKAWSALPGLESVRFVNVALPGDPAVATDDHQPSLLARSLPHLDYVRWQVKALVAARRLHRRHRFDIAWHVTWANVWIGSTAAIVGPPLVLGPVGGGVGPPWGLVPTLGVRGIAFELLRAAARTAARYLNPLARLTWQRAQLILVQNAETRDWLPVGARRRARIFQNSIPPAVPRRSRVRSPGDPPVALFAGRLVPLKGVHLAVESVARLPDWRLIVIGDGPQQRPLEAMVQQLGAADRVDFRGSLAREEVLEAMATEADVFLFPSLHDEAGMAVAEATAIGVPTVCLDRGGPPVMAGSGVRASGRTETVSRLSMALEAALDQGPPAPPQPDERLAALVTHLRDAGLLPAGEPQNVA